jgi:putative DNA primase/helicase
VKSQASDAKTEDALEVTWTGTIKAKRLDYLWKKRIARGKLTAIGGDPGVGKGTLGIDITARLSTAALWPDGGRAPLCRVLMCTGEDDPADTIVPRLDVAGADRSRVGLIGRVLTVEGKKRRISLDVDAELIVRIAAEWKVDAIIIDPLSSYLGANTNSWQDSDMRRILDTMAEAAARFGIAVIVVVHLTKGSGSNSMYRFQGSIATIAAARFGLLVAPHPQDPSLRVMASNKANLAAKPPSLSFRIVARIHPELGEEIGCIEWVGPSPLTADELLAEPDRRAGAAKLAEDFLLEYLAAGEAPSQEVKEAASKAGIGQHSIWKAKTGLGVIARKDGVAGWFWKLPFEAVADRHPSTDSADADRHASDQGQPWRSDRHPSPSFSSDEGPSYRYIDENGTEGSVAKNGGRGDDGYLKAWSETEPDLTAGDEQDPVEPDYDPDELSEVGQ